MKKISLKPATVSILGTSDKDGDFKDTRARWESVCYAQRNKDKNDSRFLVGSKLDEETIKP